MRRLAWVFFVAGCTLPGEPRGRSLEGQPSKVEDFDQLYRENCGGCHGEEGRGNASFGLANPIYLAIADDAIVHHAISEGVPRTAMPAFAQSAGGMLTAKQVDVITAGVRARWANPNAIEGATPPPYAGPTGDPQRGQAVFAEACARCHGDDGAGGTGKHSIVDGAYLDLVSDQGLRTLLIAGRPDLGHPDWRSDVQGRPLSSREIADLVAWLASHRAKKEE
jgi:mono/diheme cytochrome c family protein